MQARGEIDLATYKPTVCTQHLSELVTDDTVSVISALQDVRIDEKCSHGKEGRQYLAEAYQCIVELEAKFDAIDVADKVIKKSRRAEREARNGRLMVKLRLAMDRLLKEGENTPL